MTENWSNGCWNSALHQMNELHFKIYSNRAILNFKNISYYRFFLFCFFCIWSNKGSLGKHKKLLSKTTLNSKFLPTAELLRACKIIIMPYLQLVWQTMKWTQFKTILALICTKVRFNKECIYFIHIFYGYIHPKHSTKKVLFTLIYKLWISAVKVNALITR